MSGLIWRGSEILFLHRVQPPIIWVPPGGRVEAGEDPYSALGREIREETTLSTVEIAVPCIAEAGMHDGKEILFLDYVCRHAGGEVTLDQNEHDDWQWLDMGRLEEADVERCVAFGGEPFHIYRWGDEELLLSHSPEELRLSRRILECLE